MKKQINLLATISLVFAQLSLSGCATHGRSAMFGSATGAVAGAAVGGLAIKAKDGKTRTRNVIIGTSLGAMTGMFAGSLIHHNTEDKKEDAFKTGFLEGQKNPKSTTMPELTNPKVETRWIEGRTTGNRYIEGHFEYVIIEPARWTQE